MKTTLVTIAGIVVFAGLVWLALDMRGGGGGKGGQDGKFVVSKSGLRHLDVVVGKGRVADLGDSVFVHYTGRLKNGSKFDSSLDRGEPFQFQLGAREVIRGWDEGVRGMKEGGKRVLVIPSDLAYGPDGRGQIPPNAELTFEIELLKVQ